MFEKLSQLHKLTIDPKNATKSDIDYEASKTFADKLAECKIMVENEKDPIKKAKMELRLSLGILDFSDIK